MFLTVALFSVGLFAYSVDAVEVSYDPYADRVTAVGTATTTSNRDRAVGAPDGRSATVSGNNNFITLDMGDREEGTGSLRVHFGSQVAQTQVSVTFFDRDMQEINTQAGAILVSVGPSTQDFQFRFNDFGKAYRYVRITSLRSTGFVLDAVTASAYIGATETVDTDADGISDRSENQSGTDPQVFNETTPPPTPSPTDTTGPSMSSINVAQISPSSEHIFWSTNEPATSQVEYGINAPTTRTSVDTRLATQHSMLLSGLSSGTWYSFRVISRDAAGNETVSGTGYFVTQVAPPPASRDQDADGMDDQWETRYGLSSTNASDASGDLDSDGLSNLREYQIGSDPTKTDTDGDGMPDGWEHDRNLLPTRDDASADPDVDGMSNLSEYQKGTDPHDFDEGVAPGEDEKSNTWMWWVIGALVVIALVALLTRRNSTTIITQ